MSDTETIPVPELGTEPPSGPIPLTATPEEEAAPKRRRRRRTRAEMEAERQTAEAPPVVSEQDIARTTLALTVAFKAIGLLLKAKRGPHWELTEEECATLGASWGAAIAPHLPKIGPAVPWATAAVTTWAVIQPRVEADAQRARLAAAQPAETVE